MNRRLFIKKMSNAIRLGLLFQFSSWSCPLLSTVNASEPVNMSTSLINGMSLKEIAEEKLHHINGRFRNIFSDRTYGELWKLMKWKWFSENEFTSFYKDEPEIEVSIDWESVRRHKGLAVTFIRHSTLMIKDADQYILVDPVFSKIFWFIKDFSPLADGIRDIPRPDHILITHGHYDHLDKGSLSLMDPDTHVITPLGYDEIFGELKMNNRTRLDWFDSYKEGKREIILLPCNHWTMRNPWKGPNWSLWGSYLIKTLSGHTLYISGDVGYFDRFKELGDMVDIDLAIINLGAYEPRWFMKSSHMNPADTAKAFKELKAKHLMVVHWGTFRLGDEPVHFPPMQMREEMKRQGLLKQFLDLKPGETLFYDTFLSKNG